MKNRIRPRFEMAYTLIATAISDGKFSDSKNIPSIAVLAEMADVSKSVMWDVVKKLRNDGLIAGAPRRRFWIPGNNAKPQSPSLLHPITPRHTKHHQLELRIKNELLNGNLALGRPLPAVKELAETYGVCQPTLRKALKSLIEQDEIVPYKDGLYLSSVPAHRGPSTSRIVLLGYGTNIGHSIVFGYWHQEYIKVLEIECAKANIILDVVCFSRNDAGVLEFRKGLDRPDREPMPFSNELDILGYIYEVTGNESIEDELLAHIASFGKPVAILDELGSWPTVSRIKRYSNIRIFRNTVSDLPAKNVARFALGLGHRKALFISPHQHAEYSSRRFAGLQQTFSSIDGATLTPVVSNTAGDYATLGESRINLKSLMALYDLWKKDIPYAYLRLLKNHFAEIPTLAEGGRLNEDIAKLLIAALAHKEATIWICVNDVCAHYAIDFLEDKGISVPEDLSVVSFDDEPNALRLGITSYNFNQSATAIAMLSYITNPKKFTEKKQIIEIEGRIIQRRSTSTLPQKLL